MIERKTSFSLCRLYRWQLWRDWDTDFLTGTSDDLPYAKEFVQFIGLNPSTADETQDDPTIRRCIQFAKDWGYGAMCMTNLFAFRATDPKVMKAYKLPIGADNTNQLMDVAREAHMIVAAWGRDGNLFGRGQQVIECLSEIKPLHHLGLNSDGTPKHPLYLRSDTKPTPFAAE